MREKLQRLWASSGRWFLLGLPLAAVILGLVIWQANQAVQPPRKPLLTLPLKRRSPLTWRKTGHIPRRMGL